MAALGLGAQACMAFMAQPGIAAAEVTLTRMECGSRLAPLEVNQRFSDTFAYGGLKLQFVYSCYLVKHGDEYLLWDTGHAMTMP
jgi:N-acyl homoserine lactone hydrolase